MEHIRTHFPDLPQDQIDQLAALPDLYKDWNARINVVSRKDIDNIETHHILHSLSIAKVIQFVPGAKVLDLGTGGGFPGIPLAILYPETHFTLIDGTGKKISVVKAVAEALELKNVDARQVRAEELKGMKFDFVVSRAVAALEKLLPWSQRLLSQQHQHLMPNGLICLKGGRIKEEIKALGNREYTEIYPIKKFFDLPYFEEKVVLYVQG